MTMKVNPKLEKFLSNLLNGVLPPFIKAEYVERSAVGRGGAYLDIELRLEWGQFMEEEEVDFFYDWLFDAYTVFVLQEGRVIGEIEGNPEELQQLLRDLASKCRWR